VSVLQVEALVLQPAKRTPPNISAANTKTQLKENKLTDVVIPSTQSQAHEDGHINVRNMLSK
jgi:hypothetical protein